MSIPLTHKHSCRTIGKQEAEADSAKAAKLCRIFLFLFLSLMLLKLNVSRVDAAGPDPFQVKAAFVYNFLKFVSWPPEALPPEASKITLCILGDDSLGAAIESLSGKTISGKALSVKRIKRREDASECEIIYLCKSESRHMKEILQNVKSGVLTIGDMRNFASSGGMINFVMINNRVSFEINPDAAATGRIRISSQLLRLAKIVRDDDR
ncbi:MAG: hypothetical protein A4E72_01146 [Syntrophus sp. PtaU1.Bin208]|nr:MAG: hypothetical protein A4E72_01146 [Syntrophus sp. PtaU1.Bin208]